ncbi:chitobiase/beta-hexosaminidase C-terminal domain-containing protein, partial [Patescibacteria group bacterium]
PDLFNWLDDLIADGTVYAGSTYYHYTSDDSILYHDFPIFFSLDTVWVDPNPIYGDDYKVQAMDENGNLSNLASFDSVDIIAPTTSASPLGGTHTGTQSVTLSPNETATTYYTIDGSTPTTGSDIYSSAIIISVNTTLKYFSVDTAGNTETVKTESYTITVDAIDPITTSDPLGATFTSTQTVTLTPNESATTYYTIDGSTPTTGSTVYTTALTISADTTLKYFSVDTAGNTETVKTETYTIIPSSTTFNITDKVQTTSNLSVRATATASGTLLGTETLGNLGTVIGGPTYADTYHWWQVQYDSGTTGWSVEDWLTSYTAPNIPSCTSFTYNTWGECQVGDNQTRTIASSLPSGCQNGSPVLSQSCVYVAPDETAPTISTPSESTTTNSATISFTTDESSTTHIDYGLTTSYGTVSSTNTGTTHSFTLPSLSDATTYDYRITAIDATSNQSQTVNRTFATDALSIPDTIAPATIINLSVANITQTSVDLMSWFAPGDDNGDGTASLYDIRYATSTIDDTNWSLATQAPAEPTPSVAGTTETYTLVGLDPGVTYYAAIKTQDEVPNISLLSNIASFTTLSPLCVDADWSYSDDACQQGDTLTRTWTLTNQACENGVSKEATETVSCSYSASIGGGGDVSTPPPSSGGGGGGYYVDTIAPESVSNATITPADKQLSFIWNNPTDSDFVRTVIVKKEGSAPTSRTDGTLIYEGIGEEYTDIDLNNSQTYYYSIYTHDRRPNYSNPVTLSSKPEAGLTSIEILAPVVTTTTGTTQTITTAPIRTQLSGSFHIGLSDNRVKLLQEYLAQDTSIYPEGITSGYFGSLTQKAIQRFQTKHNIVSEGTPDTTGFGAVGPKTLEKLNEVYGAESTVIPTTTTQPTTQTTPPTSVSGTLVGPFAVGYDNAQVKLLQEYLAQDTSIYPEGITT